ncbi:hypothetical protein SOV_35080 [Sporomusa ovata DSM 2662]|uniref:hypothetical protein n=1 Tax=Sporomusa ovata TaxID=2378 RepID=UPI0003887830|nr:hypothetical protein [Sporomusa ovata]EQB24657.1 hypothetical protein SOV_6c00710 [Sporomusa ovata DSM 2662]
MFRTILDVNWDVQSEVFRAKRLTSQQNLPIEPQNYLHAKFLIASEEWNRGLPSYGISIFFDLFLSHDYKCVHYNFILSRLKCVPPGTLLNGNKLILNINDLG